MDHSPANRWQSGQKEGKNGLLDVLGLINRSFIPFQVVFNIQGRPEDEAKLIFCRFL